MNEHAAFILGALFAASIGCAIHAACFRMWRDFAINLVTALSFLAFHLWVFR